MYYDLSSAAMFTHAYVFCGQCHVFINKMTPIAEHFMNEHGIFVVGEIDKCIKKVTEGVEQFEDVWQKVRLYFNFQLKFLFGQSKLTIFWSLSYII